MFYFIYSLLIPKEIKLMLHTIHTHFSGQKKQIYNTNHDPRAGKELPHQKQSTEIKNTSRLPLYQFKPTDSAVLKDVLKKIAITPVGKYGQNVKVRDLPLEYIHTRNSLDEIRKKAEVVTMPESFLALLINNGSQLIGGFSSFFGSTFFATLSANSSNHNEDASGNSKNPSPGHSSLQSSNALSEPTQFNAPISLQSLLHRHYRSVNLLAVSEASITAELSTKNTKPFLLNRNSTLFPTNSTETISLNSINKEDIISFIQTSYFFNGSGQKLKNLANSLNKMPKEGLPFWDAKQFSSSLYKELMSHFFKNIYKIEVPFEDLDKAFIDFSFKRLLMEAANIDGYDISQKMSVVKNTLLSALHRTLVLDQAHGFTRVVLLERLDTALGIRNKRFPPQRTDISQRAQKLLQSVIGNTNQFDFWKNDIAISLVDPTLIRTDFPVDFKYGGLEWVFAQIAINVVGEKHWDYSPTELISFGSIINAIAEDAYKKGDATLLLAQIKPILLSAHAHDIINLTIANSEQNPQVIKEALQFFQNLLEKHYRHFEDKNQFIEDLVKGLPHRHDLAIKKISSLGLSTAQTYSLPQSNPIAGGLQGAVDRRTNENCKSSKTLTLVQILMSNCVLNYQANLPSAASRLSYSQLNASFDKKFNEGIQNIAKTHVAPSINWKINALTERESKFWKEGQWEIFSFSAKINTKVPPYQDQGSSQLNSRLHRTKYIDYNAKSAAIVKIKLQEGAVLSERSYAITLSPFELTRIETSIDDFLRKKQATFFKTDLAEHTLLEVKSTNQNLIFSHPKDQFSSRNAKKINKKEGFQTGLSKLSEFLVKPLNDFRNEFYEKTRAEQSREGIKETLLDLIPFRACARDIQAHQSGSGVFRCSLDALAILPLVGVGIRAVSLAEELAIGMTETALEELANTAIKEGEANLASVADNGFNSLMNLVSGAENSFNNLAHEVGVQVALYLDPGFMMGKDLFSLGKFTLGKIFQRLKGLPQLSHLGSKIEHQFALNEHFFSSKGYWQARPEKIEVIKGERFIRMKDSPPLLIMDIAEAKDVIVNRVDGHWMQLNPDTNKVFGPKLWLENGSTHRLSHLPPERQKVVLPVEEIKIAEEKTSICRVKRADDAMTCFSITKVMIDQREAYKFPINSDLSSEKFYQYRPGSALNEHYIDSDSYIFLQPLNINKRNFYGFYKFGDLYEVNALENKFEKLNLNVDRIEGFSSSQEYDGKFSVLPTGEAGIHVTKHYQYETVSSGTSFFKDERIVPYETYTAENGDCMGMIEIDDNFYSFKIENGWTHSPALNTKMLLRKVEEESEEFAIYFQHKIINQKPLANPVSDSLTVVSNEERRKEAILFKDMDLSSKQKIENMISRVDEILSNVQTVLTDPKYETLCYSMIKKFLEAIEESEDNILLLIEQYKVRLKQEIQKLQSGAKHLKKYIETAISSAEYNSDTGIEAEATVNSLEKLVNLSHASQPIIVLSRTILEKNTPEQRASTLLHELTHARSGTTDGLEKDFYSIDVYPKIPDPNHPETMIDDKLHPDIYIWQIIDHADLNSHFEIAATLEHEIMMLSYLKEPDTQKLVRPFLTDPDSYRYTLKTDPIVSASAQRNKRSDLNWVDPLAA